ncbi:MAG: ABC transporter substrate-binding protein [bacterium]|nr:ABC transporter substrate-binding protein [bacterium]
MKELLSVKEKIKQLFKKQWTVSPIKNAETAVKGFSHLERLIFYALLLICAGASFFLLSHVNTAYLVEIPKFGGTLTEGVVGSPRFINPILAISDADRDLTALIYSGLLKPEGDGTLTVNLAKEYNVSEDGLVYTFILREDAYFHDGKPVTADDVIFTVELAKDPFLKSPKRANWEGVTVEKVNDYEVRFILRQPYSPFLENTTIGILPKHIWKDAEIEQFPFSQFNVEPIGSGPYKVKKIKRSNAGVPTYYHLTSFKDYASGEPFIENLIIRFYGSEKSLIESYARKDIESMSAISPEDSAKLEIAGANIVSASLPRVFGVFFNQNQATILSEKAVREALDTALDKQAIVTEVLKGYGSPLNGPIPKDMIKINSETQTQEKTEGEEAQTVEESPTEKALKIFEKAGWEINEETGLLEKKVKEETQTLSFSLSTSNAPELKHAAEMIQEMWKAVGVEVSVNIFESGDLNQNVIRPRKYDALLFGEVVGRDLDLFAFWHSSQRNDPGLNIALYANITADKLLDEVRTINDSDLRAEKYLAFEKEVVNDLPASFLYSPDFLYVVPAKVKNMDIGQIAVPHERFASIKNWYIETEKVWKVFVPESITTRF